MIRSVFDASPIGVGVWTVDGHLVHANPVFCQLLGRTLEALSGELFEHLIHPQDATSIVGKIGDLWAARRNYFECDLRCVGPQGETLWLRAFLAPVYGPTGEPDYLVSQVFSLAPRSERDEILRQMANNTPVMLWLTDTTGRPRLGNKLANEFMGTEGEDLSGVWANAIEPTDMARVNDALEAAATSHEPFEFLARLAEA